MQIIIRQNGDKTEIRSPYNPHNNAQFRSRGGKFESANKSWVLLTRQATPIIKDLFGESEEIVTVEVPLSHPAVNGKDGYLTIGGYTLTSRRSRDYTADHIEPLVQGTIPARGGSVKHPSVNPSSDAVWSVEMRKDFAIRHGLAVKASVAA